MNKVYGEVFKYLFNLLLIIAILKSFSEMNWILAFAISIFTLTIYSSHLQKSFSLIKPNKIETFLLLLFYFVEFFSGTNLLDRIITYLIVSFIIGFTGFSLVYFMNREKKVLFNLDPLFISLFVFCFSMSVGAIWQVIRFLSVFLFNINIQNYNPGEAMSFIVVHTFGAALISVLGFLYLENNNDRFFIKSFLKKRLSQDLNAAKKEKIYFLLKGDESEELEFKSTLRTNLHTNEHDKRIEFSVLKSLAAFVNTNGGNLLVGVNDDREVIGIKKDNFKSDDKTSLHITNLIKKHLGEDFMTFVKFYLIKIEEETVILFECKRGDGEFFLKDGSDEYFFIRSGPSTNQLTGSKLLTYTKKRY